MSEEKRGASQTQRARHARDEREKASKTPDRDTRPKTPADRERAVDDRPARREGR